MYRLGKRSKERLEGVHPNLIRVVGRGITKTTVDFTVLEGKRLYARQEKLFAAGASKSMNSRHLVKKIADGGTGYAYAVDLGAWVDRQVDWSWPLYYKIADAMNEAADELGINIIWGGDWDDDGDYEDEGFRDGPHFQLPWADYPA